jgi:hypothetical protein
LLSSSSDKIASSIKNSKSSTVVTEQSLSQSSETYVSQPRTEYDTLLREQALLSTIVDEKHCQ